MSYSIIQLDEDLIKHDLKDLVRSSVEETLNALLDHGANELVNTLKCEFYSSVTYLCSVARTAPAPAVNSVK